ncbi:MAG: epimerase [Bacteroidetes bacterium]|nr:epimerase [Bacteroidota bacterium]
MHLLLYGASGMVGSGTLDVALDDSRVTKVTTVGRRSLGRSHPKLDEIVHSDLFDVSAFADRLVGIDGCVFALGVSSVGMSPEDYEHLTYDLTLAHAEVLARQNPSMRFGYVSGRGTDSTEQGRVRWARVKGRTENALMRLPFRAAYAFRPGLILATNGTGPKVPWIKRVYALLEPLYPLLRRVWPNAVSTTDVLGRAMIEAVLVGAPKAVLEVPDLNALGQR